MNFMIDKNNIKCFKKIFENIIIIANNVELFHDKIVLFDIKRI